MATAREPEPRTAIIQIDVQREDPASPLLSGTFHQPPSLVRINRYTKVKWQLHKVHANDSFVVSFPNGSPFPKVRAVSERTEALSAEEEGSFHYQVFVTDGSSGMVYAIHNCPQLEVNRTDDN
ncbi:MAG TPA: hypothetical protein VKV74_17790 [Bryobacteraceae bacterium]|nr:hypothetical protein [Bryobacteraceae bacterium]